MSSAMSSTRAAPHPPRHVGTAQSFPARICETFVSQANQAYLKWYLMKYTPTAETRQIAERTTATAVWDYSKGAGRELFESDPQAQRGAAPDLWSEVRRVNRAFLAAQMAVLCDIARRNAPRGKDDSGMYADDEPYHVRAFAEDSLRPAGLEGLNGPDTRPASASAAASSADFHNYDGGDQPWNPQGDAGRSAQRAEFEYWGEDRVATDMSPGTKAHASARSSDGAAYSDRDSWSEQPDNKGARMRITGIPRNQRTGARSYDHDIEETLGTQERESDTQVRGWKKPHAGPVGSQPKGQSYMRLAPSARPQCPLTPSVLIKKQPACYY
jgi:hypothetical protein